MDSRYAWIDKEEYPFRSNYIQIESAKMHYIDEGEGDVLLFIHGTPSWSFDFRYIIKNLSKEYRCIAVDHLGFGLSDKPINYTYSLDNHVANIDRLINYLQLKNVTLIVHDFGGPLGFKYALSYPRNIDRFVIFNTWMWSAVGNPAYEKLKPMLKSPLLPILYKYLNFSVKYLLPTSFGDHKLSPSIHKMYLKPFAHRSERNGPLAFARSLVNDQLWFDDLWKQRSKISEIPTLFIWGMKDTFVTEDYLEVFESEFTNFKTLRLPDAGHFPQEECPDEVIDSICEFLKDPFHDHTKRTTTG